MTLPRLSIYYQTTTSLHLHQATHPMLCTHARMHAHRNRFRSFLPLPCPNPPTCPPAGNVTHGLQSLILSVVPGLLCSHPGAYSTHRKRIMQTKLRVVPVLILMQSTQSNLKVDCTHTQLSKSLHEHTAERVCSVSTCTYLVRVKCSITRMQA